MMGRNAFQFVLSLLVVTGTCLGCFQESISEENDSDIFDDDIYPVDETREPCFAEETWQCVDDILHLCRNGFWNPWYNCAWNGGTCWAAEDGASGECIDPEDTQVACPDDNEECVMCSPDPPVIPDDLDDGLIGCCSSDGNAYSGESEIVMETCTGGCCAFFDFEDTLLRHDCCQ